MAQLHQSTAPRRALDNPLVYVLVALAILAVGGGMFAYLMLTRSQPGGTGETLPPRLVRVFEARQSSHQLAVTAYGTSRAAEVWTAISEVSGRAEQVNPLFEVGEVLAAGTLLVQIELTDYELARDRFQAEVDARQLAIKELDQNQANLRDILGLQQRRGSRKRIRRPADRRTTDPAKPGADARQAATVGGLAQGGHGPVAAGPARPGALPDHLAHGCPLRVQVD
jgi:multidrug efflux pump subunit AcrA (membrane-fusion protein)